VTSIPHSSMHHLFLRDAPEKAGSGSNS